MYRVLKGKKMIKVISFTICPFVQRVTAALELKKIPYEIEFISLSDKPDWFLNVSPNGQVPLLITDDDCVLFESDAIIEYLDDKYGAVDLTLNPEEKAIERAWSYLASKNYLVQCSAMRTSNCEDFENRFSKLKLAFSKIEEKLNGVSYFNGSSMGKVEMAWTPLLHRSLIVKQETGYDLLDDHPNTSKWRERINASGIFEQSVPENFKEKFKQFYISDTTILGKMKSGTELDCESTECSTSTCC